SAVPHPGLTPSHKTTMAGCVSAELVRQSPPGRTSPQHPEDPVQNSPIIYSPNTTRLVWQQGCNHLPLEVSYATVHGYRSPKGGRLSACQCIHQQFIGPGQSYITLTQLEVFGRRRCSSWIVDGLVAVLAKIVGQAHLEG